MRRICGDSPGLRGLVKVVPDDFVVEEIADWRPHDEGPHIMLWVEKHALNTRDVVGDLARMLGLPEPEIGIAGQKDRQAVTRQWISVPAHAVLKGVDVDSDAGLERIDLPAGRGWRTLRARRHGSKLRTGRLLGNRFDIRVRGAASDLDAAQSILARLAVVGLPNYFGPQRFGRKADNAERGLEVITGARRESGHHRRRLYISALQSKLFNGWLDERVDDGLLHVPVEGDVVRDRQAALSGDFGTGMLRHTDANTDDTEAVAAGELDAMGPIFGAHMMASLGSAAEREKRVLAREGLSIEDFEEVVRDAPGSRRPARAWFADASVTVEGEDLLLAFSLERGAYATVALHELGL